MGSDTSRLFILKSVYHESKRQFEALPGKKCLETVGEKWITKKLLAHNLTTDILCLLKTKSESQAK